GAFECVDPEEQLDEVVVDRVIGSLHHEDIAAAHILEHADKDVPFAEDMSLRLGEIVFQVATDRLSQRGARTAREDLQLAIGVGPLRGLVTTDQRLVHGHCVCPADRVGKSPRKRVGTFLGSPRARPWTRSLILKQPLHILTTARDTCQQGNGTSSRQPPRQPRRHSTPCPFPQSSLQYSYWKRVSHSRSPATIEVFWHDSSSFVPPPPAGCIGSVRIFRSDIRRTLS